MTSRRGFFGALVAAVAGMLWRPGAALAAKVPLQITSVDYLPISSELLPDGIGVRKTCQVAIRFNRPLEKGDDLRSAMFDRVCFYSPDPGFLRVRSTLQAKKGGTQMTGETVDVQRLVV